MSRSPKCGNAMPPVYADAYTDQLDEVGKDGCFPVPDGPGLGVTYDWDFIKRHRTQLHEFKQDGGPRQICGAGRIAASMHCPCDPKGLLTVPAYPDYITDQSVTFWPQGEQTRGSDQS